MKTIWMILLMVLMYNLMYAQCNVSATQGSYLSGYCGEITVQGGIVGGTTLYGQCGGFQFVPPWAGNDIITSVGQTPYNGITVFPNPTSGFVNIQNGRRLDFAHVYNSMGELVKSIHSFNENNNLDLSALPSGLYILKIYSIDHSYAITQIILQTN